MLETSLPADLPPVECREVQIGQILLNLLNNAFDAIDAAPHSERWVKVCATSLPHSNGFPARMQIDVIDGGPGIAEEHHVHLMEPFFTTKPVGAGIGIGLSPSRANSQDHH